MNDRPKVFCIGFMKTGTTALNQALQVLGYRVSDKSWRLLRPIMRGDWNAVKEHASAWDALEDNPIPLIYKELDRMFPGSKFILSTRDPEKWFNSVSYHIGELPNPTHEWLFGKGKSLPKKDKSHAIGVFEAHNRAVKEYFRDRPEDLLVMDVSQGEQWTVLCDFLGLAVPETDFPHANKSRFDKDKHRGLKRRLKYWKKRLVNPLKIWRYRQLNYIPSPADRISL